MGNAHGSLRLRTLTPTDPDACGSRRLRILTPADRRLQVDEKSDFQILIYASLAKDESDILPGHIWVERQFLEVQNMKYYCPTVLQARQPPPSPDVITRHQMSSRVIRRHHADPCLAACVPPPTRIYR